MKLHTLFVIGLLGAAGLAAQAQADKNVSSVLICRGHQCASSAYSMSRGFLLNKIGQLIEENIGKTAMLCEADPVSHVCLTEGLKLTARTAYFKVDTRIDAARVVDAKLVKDAAGLDIIFDYRVRANNTYPSCETALSRLSVPFVDKVELRTADFACRFTETGSASLNITYNIDYVDFDYGVIGAYYTLGAAQAVRGDKNGYALMRFTAKTAGLGDDVSVNAVKPVPPVQSARVPTAARYRPPAGVMPLDVLPPHYAGPAPIIIRTVTQQEAAPVSSHVIQVREAPAQTAPDGSAASPAEGTSGQALPQ